MTLQIQDTFATGGRGTPNAWSPLSSQPQTGGPFTWAQLAGSATMGYSGARSTGSLTGNTSTNVLTCGPKAYYPTNSVVQCTKTTSVASHSGIVARVAAATTYYVAFFASGTLTLAAVVGGVSTTLGTYAFTETLGTTYSVRIQVSGQTSNTVSAKVWSGDTEPGAFQITASADTHIVAPGLPGVYGVCHSAGETLTFSAFTAIWPPGGVIAQTGANPYGHVIVANPATDPTGIEMAYNAVNIGHGWLRWQHAWSQVEKSQTPPYYNWTELDAIVQAVNALGLNLLLMMHNPPVWHMISPCGPGYEIMDPSAAAKFAAVLVNHYNLGTNGHVEAIEWGNEDYSKGYLTCPNGSYAAQLMAQVYPAIKTLDSSIIVGPPATYMGNKMTPWWYGDPLVGFFPNGGGESVDFLNIHDYPCPLGPLDFDYTGMRMVDYLTLVNTVASANGYGHLPIWITENAWPSYSNSQCMVPEATKTTDYQGILDWSRQNTPLVTHHFWYNMAALARYSGAGQLFEPAYDMMQSYQQTYPQWVGNTSSYKAAVLQDAPACYYRVDESSGIVAVDSSGHTANGAYAGSGVTYDVPGLLTGDSDTAVALNGTSGTLLCPPAINMTGWTALTLEGWYKPTSLVAANTLFANDTPASDNRGVQLTLPAGGTKLIFAIGLGTSFILFQPAFTFTAGSAYYIVATWDGATMTVYVNGASIGTHTCQGAISAPSMQLGIGYNPKARSNYFTGTVDELACYNACLSAARVAAHYKAGEGGATAPVLAVTPTQLTPQTPGVTQTGSTYTAVVTLTESSSSVGDAHWTTATSLSGITFTPAAGTLTPGAAVTVTISNIPASSGTFTFAGTEGEAPVVVTWTIAGPTGPGGFGIYAQAATGVVSFDHLRVTQFPDPAIALAPVLPRAGQSVVTWDANLPTNTNLDVAISYDGVTWLDVTDNQGGGLPALASQNPPVVDVFSTNSSATYLQATSSVGSPATWTWDTTNSRLLAGGGTQAVLLNTTLVGTEWDSTFDLDEADVGGIVYNWLDGSDYYALTVTDDAATHAPAAQVVLSKVVAGVSTTLATAAISFPRGEIHRCHLNLLGGVHTVWFDGAMLCTVTDTSLTQAGQAGCYTSGGTGSLARWYALWLCPQGQNVSGTPAGDTTTGMFVYSQWSLYTTDPTVGPQVTDDSISVRSPTIETGALITQLHSPNQPFAAYVSSEIQNLVSQNGDWWAKIDQNKVMNFRSPGAIPAPFVLTTVGTSNIKLRTKQQAKVTLGGDTYRNQQTVLPVDASVTPAPYQFLSDGAATSWTVGYPIISTPTITVNGQPQTVGQTGIDVGKTFYWQPGNNTVTLGAGITAFPFGYVLEIAITGSYQTIAQVSDPAEIARRALIETGTSGIVEQVFQIPNQSGNANALLPWAQGLTMAQGYLTRFEHETTDLVCDTLLSGLAPGQTVACFIPEHGLWNKQLVILNVQVQLLLTPPTGATVAVYTVEASDGPNIGPWSAALGRTR